MNKKIVVLVCAIGSVIYAADSTSDSGQFEVLKVFVERKTDPFSIAIRPGWQAAFYEDFRVKKLIEQGEQNPICALFQQEFKKNKDIKAVKKPYGDNKHKVIQKLTEMEESYDRAGALCNIIREDGSVELINVFLNNGVDPNATEFGSWFHAPLEVALLNDRHDVAELLLEKGALVDGPNRVSYFPLMHAVIVGNQRMATFLLDHDANIDTVSESMVTTALVEAARRGNFPMVKMLVERGAHVQIHYIFAKPRRCGKIDLVVKAYLDEKLENHQEKWSPELTEAFQTAKGYFLNEMHNARQDASEDSKIDKIKSVCICAKEQVDVLLEKDQFTLSPGVKKKLTAVCQHVESENISTWNSICKFHAIKRFIQDPLDKDSFRLSEEKRRQLEAVKGYLEKVMVNQESLEIQE